MIQKHTIAGLGKGKGFIKEDVELLEDLTAFLWELTMPRTGRLRLQLFCAASKSKAFFDHLRALGIRAIRNSQGSLRIERAADIARFFHLVDDRQDYRDVFDAYAAAWAPSKRGVKPTAGELEERERAARHAFAVAGPRPPSRDRAGAGP